METMADASHRLQSLETVYKSLLVFVEEGLDAIAEAKRAELHSADAFLNLVDNVCEFLHIDGVPHRLLTDDDDPIEFD
jgi:hypothetical protein